MTAQQLKNKRELIIGLLKTADHHIVQIKGIDKHLRKQFGNLRKNVMLAFEPLLDEANAPQPDKTIKDILTELVKKERLTPEILDEIRGALKKL